MEYFLIDSNDSASECVGRAGSILAKGGVVLHATDTVYGLACRWDSLEAIKRVASIKNRGIDKPSSIMCRTVSQIEELVSLDAATVGILGTLLPGAVTFLLPRNKNIHTYWDQFPLLGFRIPADNISTALLINANVPLITTSANVAGEPAPTSPDGISDQVSNQVDIFLDSGFSSSASPSVIVSLDPGTKSYQIMREGPIAEDVIRDCIERFW